jgi:hypothetical protein
MREKNKWILNAGGERTLLYKRRYEGTVCPLFDKVRMTSQQHGQDAVCQGTGFTGPNPLLGPNQTTGYFDPIEIYVSFVAGGPRTVEVGDFGRRQTLPVRCWTLWEPLITEGDFLVRRDNTRLWIQAPTPHRFKHYVLHQSFDILEVERAHEIYNIPSGL